MIRILSLSMLATGAAAFALVGYMQYDPLAFTALNVIESEALKTPIVTERAPEAITEADSPRVIELPAFVIVGRWYASARPIAIEPAVAPCSPWRDLGFKYVENGEPSGVQRVRQLCASVTPQVGASNQNEGGIIHFE